MARNSVALLMVASLISVAIGCAAGRRLNYRNASPSLPVRGEMTVAIATHDQRSFVVSGEKRPNFVGLQRSGAGIPYAVGTGSGRPLAEDFTEVISAALKRSGYGSTPVIVGHADAREAVLAQLAATGADRLLLVTLTEWKTDVYNNTTLRYDVRLEIFDAAGASLAESSVRGKDGLGGSIWNPPGHAAKAVPKAYQAKLEQLFGTSEVRHAM